MTKGIYDDHQIGQGDFGPAFGTYALGALASHGIAPWIGGKIGKAMVKFRSDSKEN